MITATDPLYTLVLYYLLRDDHEQTGDYLPEFTRRLTTVVDDLNRSGWTASDFTHLLPAADAWDQVFTTTEQLQQGTYTHDAVAGLEPAVRVLQAAHPA